MAIATTIVMVQFPTARELAAYMNTNKASLTTGQLSVSYDNLSNNWVLIYW